MSPDVVPRGAKNALNTFVTPHWTQLGELTAFPRPLVALKGAYF